MRRILSRLANAIPESAIDTQVGRARKALFRLSDRAERAGDRDIGGRPRGLLSHYSG